MAAPIDYTRKPLEPFPDARVETYCRTRAAGGTQAQACQEAVIAKATAQSMDRQDDVAKRITELKAAKRDFTMVGMGWVMDTLLRNTEAALTNGDHKSCNQGLAMMARFIKENTTERPGAAAVARKAMRDDFRSQLGAPLVIEAEGEEVPHDDASE